MKSLIFRRTILLVISCFIILYLLNTLLRGGYFNRIDYEFGSMNDPIYISGIAIVEFLAKILPPNEPGTDVNPTDRLPWYYLGGFAGIGLVIAISLPLLFWNHKPSTRAKTIAFVLSLFVLMSLSIANYAYHDMLMDVSVQVVLDFMLVFVGTWVVVQCLSMKPTSVAGKIGLVMLLFILVLEAILLPFVYGSRKAKEGILL